MDQIFFFFLIPNTHIFLGLSRNKTKWFAYKIGLKHPDHPPFPSKNNSTKKKKKKKRSNNPRIIQNIEPTSYSILPPSPFLKNENLMLPTTGIRNKFKTFTYENFDGHGVYIYFFIFF